MYCAKDRGIKYSAKIKRLYLELKFSTSPSFAFRLITYPLHRFGKDEDVVGEWLRHRCRE